MEFDLLEKSTVELLEKFGAGSHKPGSGSAAAFQGMLSAKLLITVISLTTDIKRRSRYEHVYDQLVEMEKFIHERIFPELKNLFNEDAVQFGKTIDARKARNFEDDPFKNQKLTNQALQELKISIDIPLSIGRLCVELAEIAEFVFENGFQAARGDSQVALSGSVAGIAGCLSIIQLNLLSFKSDEYIWTSEKNKEAKKLKFRYRQLHEIADSKIEILEREAEQKEKFYGEVDRYLKKIRVKKNLLDEDIEKVASGLQNLVWNNKDHIWPEDAPEHHAKILKPGLILRKALAYKFSTLDKIENPENWNSKVAGLIDQNDKVVIISREFDKNVQNYTAAHELGHALLHEQKILHRDRPVDGVNNSSKRSLIEYQADKFASYFLMPASIIINEFKEIFETGRFEINDESVFKFNINSESELRAECKSMRGLALKLATSERYSNKSFVSLSKLFQVSPTAMAIRLEELNLLEF